jgi:hypothetical protein
MTVVNGGNSGLCQWRRQGARVIWARAKEGVRPRARATRVARATMAREGKRARARAANGGNGDHAAIGFVVMAVTAFDGGGGDCNLCQRRRQGGRVTRARADKGARVRARADKEQGHNNNKREGGGGEVASFIKGKNWKIPLYRGP